MIANYCANVSQAHAIRHNKSIECLKRAMISSYASGMRDLLACYVKRMISRWFADVHSLVRRSFIDDLP
jgi:hypothetical protein